MFLKLRTKPRERTLKYSSKPIDTNIQPGKTMAKKHFQIKCWLSPSIQSSPIKAPHLLARRHWAIQSLPGFIRGLNEHTRNNTHMYTSAKKKPLLIQGSPGNVQENKVHVSDDQVEMRDLENVCFTMSTRRHRRYKQLPNLIQKKATPFSFPVGQRSHSCSVKLPLATQCLAGLKNAAVWELCSIFLPTSNEGAYSTILDSPKCCNWYFWSTERQQLHALNGYSWQIVICF